MAHDPDAGVEPAFPAPPGACDAHFHVFGPPDRYPYDASDLRYRPPVEPLDAYLRMIRPLGFERFVFVQPSAYGFDNACMLDAMREMDPALRRGIVHLDEHAATDSEIADLSGLGIVGVRINVSPVRKPEAGLADALRPRIVHLADRLKEVGWHIDFLLPGWLVIELMATLREPSGAVLGRPYGPVPGRTRARADRLPVLPRPRGGRLRPLLAQAHRHLPLLG